ncbi:MAG: Eco57I restriction-modification methylase domain-containing protein, partial [Muribaculaceae bacterium]|nr:Eco57I restriction-modification methylase domain-containing protein [Muribaculaceae bacterium]
MTYSKEQLRKIFQNKFDREAWKAIVKGIFQANVRTTPEKFSTPGGTEDGYYFGFGETADRFKIGYFYYRIKSGSVAHKKVGLRNLVKGFLNQTSGEFDAAMVVFDDGKDWRLSFICDIKEEATTPKRFTYVFGEHDNFYRTAIERFNLLQEQTPTFKNIRKAFSVDALSDDFFDEYRELYADFVEYITGKRYVKEGNKWVERVIDKPNYQYESTFGGDDKLVRDYIKKMFGRIVFLYFLQRKGWLDGNRQYMHDLFYNSDKKDNFLDGVLELLFFEVLNTDKPYRTNAARSLPGSENIPYLNGGLFARDEIDERTCIFKEDDFERLFDFLDSYNFTIDENDTDDAEIGIDPEMLGRIFENLLEDNKDKGAFYTPKEIVDYMCRESLIAYLLNGLPERSHELIRNFVETFDASQLDEKQRLFIRKKLQAVKICDPAIGSGAFPMGLVNILSKLYVSMKADTDTAKMKRHIMEQNIYGVDIEKGAVDIARLRFWLAMIVEEKEPIPLPNLHFKIMQGNSLLENYNGIDLSDLTKINGQSSLFDSENSEREALMSSLKLYYKTSDHTKRDQLFNDIIHNVRRQLLDKGIVLPSGEDPSANTDFFLWHTWFADVFADGGFDIVIANPPYIDSETMTQLGMEKQREYISHNYRYISGNWDIYMAFLEKGLELSKGIMCYITPDKWLSKPFGKKFRKERMCGSLSRIVHAGSEVFETATVDAIISLFVQQSKKITAYVFNQKKEIEQRGSIKTTEIINPYLIDSLFSPYAYLLHKIDSQTNSHLIDLAKCEGACSTGDAYKLVPLIREQESNMPSYRLVNTGTLDKFATRWGYKEIVYLTKELGFRPISPIVPIALFEDTFGKAYRTKAKGPKIIMKGLNLLDAFVDTDGVYLPGKTTLVINSSNIDNLFLIAGVLNSAYAIFYIKTKYSSSSYCGGITFTKDMID